MITLLTPNNRNWTKHTYILRFGAYGDTVLMLWANSLEDALDEAIDWIADNEPGLLCDDAVQEAYKETYEAEIASGAEEEDARARAGEEAEIDTTCGGNCGHYILSYEWGIVAEDPTRAELKSIIERHGGAAVARS